MRLSCTVLTLPCFLVSACFLWGKRHSTWLVSLTPDLWTNIISFYLKVLNLWTNNNSFYFDLWTNKRSSYPLIWRRRNSHLRLTFQNALGICFSVKEPISKENKYQEKGIDMFLLEGDLMAKKKEMYLWILLTLVKCAFGYFDTVRSLAKTHNALSNKMKQNYRVKYFVVNSSWSVV